MKRTDPRGYHTLLSNGRKEGPIDISSVTYGPIHQLWAGVTLSDGKHYLAVAEVSDITNADNNILNDLKNHYDEYKHFLVIVNNTKIQFLFSLGCHSVNHYKIKPKASHQY